MKEEHIVFYKFVRFFMNIFYKLWYNPLVIGKENIPRNESIVFCGNHIHVLDQCSVIFNTERMIHFMAKKEYFDGKLSWFFKLGGCIPVDRTKKDSNSTQKALDILSKGQTVGIFPEGTRNSVICKSNKTNELYDLCKKDYTYKQFKKVLKNNQVKISQVDYLFELKNKKIITNKEYICNIVNPDRFLLELLRKNTINKNDYNNSLFLSFKYGSVSLANKTDSFIVPFVTRGKYTFRSKDLTVIIGKPFKVGNMSLDEANKKLKREMILLINKNN